MKKRRLPGFCAALAAALSIACFAAPLPVRAEEAPQTAVLSIVHHAESLRYGARGEAFDFTTLPASLSAWVEFPEGGGLKMEIEVAWQITPQNRESAEAYKTFRVEGSYGQATDIYGRKYALENAATFEEQPAVTVQFVDRAPVANWSIDPLTMYWNQGRGYPGYVTVSLTIDQAFDFAYAERTFLEYSYTEDFSQAESYAMDEFWDDGNVANVILYNEKIRDSEEDTGRYFSDYELMKLMTAPAYFRIRVVGGFWEGISTQLMTTAAGGAVLAPPPPDLPPGTQGDIGGNRGGGLAFWSSPGGITLSVALGLAGAGGCFALGFVFSRLLLKREEKRCGRL